MRGLFTFFALIIAACSGSSIPTVQSISVPIATSAPAATRFVYVADGATNQLLVYPYGVVKAAPIRRVRLGGLPQAVATDHRGNVYVSVWTTSQVRVYASGATRLLRVIRSGIYRPTGVAIDASDNLYVGTRCRIGICNVSSVREFKPAAAVSFRGIYDLPRFGVEGVAVDAAGDVWMDSVIGPASGVGLRFVNGSWDGTCLQLISSWGIVVGPKATVYAASLSDVARFGPKGLYGGGTIFRRYGVGATVRFIGSGPNGMIVVPVQKQKPGVSFVDVIAGLKSYRVVNGIRFPVGAAAGY